MTATLSSGAPKQVPVIGKVMKRELVMLKDVRGLRFRLRACRFLLTVALPRSLAVGAFDRRQSKSAGDLRSM
jgi:hypothetical protein